MTFLAGHGEICPPPHMGHPHDDPQTSPQHADPHGLGAFFKKQKKPIQEIHVDRRVVGWSAGRHVDHPCGGKFRHGLLQKNIDKMQHFPWFFHPVSPYPLKFRGWQFHPKFKGRPPENTVKQGVSDTPMMVGFLYVAGAETLIFVTGASGKYPKLFVSRQNNQSQLWIPWKPRNIGVWVSGAEIQTSGVDTRTAVWVSTPEKFSKIVLGKTRHFLGSVFGRTDFSRILFFEPPDFVADFVAGFFLLIFVGKSAQKNPPGKSPTKSSKFYTTKIPDNFLQRGQANIFLESLGGSQRQLCIKTRPLSNPKI